MLKRLFFFLITIFLLSFIQAQGAYKFTEVIDLDATPVISQGRTGTCWSFSSTSFLESEIIRLTGKQIDLSEMYTVRNTYPKKAENFVMRQGKAQFSEGGLAHDVMNSVTEYGLVPNSAYSGLLFNEANHNHAELSAVLRSMVETYVDNPGKKLSKKWKPAIDAVLSTYIGENPETFVYEGKTYTPQSFLEMTKINPSDYVNITSFTHAPFYSKFILNIPDNWSNGSFYNVPLDQMMTTIDNALENGFTVELDCDVSERTFSSKHGVAVIPENPENNKKALEAIYPEKQITQEYRQDEFENYTTTDDHLMHITGVLKDQNGTKYYKVKNSWGTDASRNANGGYVYFSESYMRLKAISITVHKDAIRKKTMEQLHFN
ncbi:C1 family peptidase [Hyunsoonleella pacifica]|uniref:Aminopeptidase n=1 Tax=Hyunsoonleella pacifica TaxID=1080224 RepID=A0A4Q9FSD8_9FLAO|nr:C1 family peptidase [Hyunsoonleella pacifica]TBN16637.1 aminopeptidase [Hyunsoonleella pacifica]GGD17813.1 aminopeptidase [Hyunsoonleella pacifica]